MKPKRTHNSIRRRLSLYLGGGLLALWTASSLTGSLAALHEINEAADSQMAQLAQTLAQVSRHAQPAAHGNPQSAAGNTNSDYGFAVWNRDGKRIIADKTGSSIPFETRSGFYDSPLLPDGQRYFYLHQADSGLTVAVSQSREERLATVFGTVGIPFLLSLLTLPLLILLVRFGIKRGLAPLDTLAAELGRRDAGNLNPVSEDVPDEVRTTVRSLNTLFARVSDSVARERRFTSDAAHELRSPLAALKVQAEVLAMSRSEDEQHHHLARIHESIDRARRLTDQLLVLSRLDPLEAVPDAEPADWQAVSHAALQSTNVQAREKRIRLQLQSPCGEQNALPLEGSATLLELILRNLLDNAVRYSPENSTVTLHLETDRIRERFYRPAGQNETGSGLGLSIVESIARLHGLRINLHNLPEGGLCAEITR